jgi:hypothetical protein
MLHSARLLTWQLLPRETSGRGREVADAGCVRSVVAGARGVRVAQVAPWLGVAPVTSAGQQNEQRGKIAAEGQKWLPWSPSVLDAGRVDRGLMAVRHKKKQVKEGDLGLSEYEMAGRRRGHRLMKARPSYTFWGRVSSARREVFTRA